MSTSSFAGRSLDQWYVKVNQIYLRRNFNRDSFALFGHLVEVMGGLSLLAAEKEKAEVDPHDFVAKALAWWMSLCGKVGVKSISQMLWLKFPNVCPYCLAKPHLQNCAELKHERAS